MADRLVMAVSWWKRRRQPLLPCFPPPSSLTNLQAQTSFGRGEVQLPGGLKPLVEASTSFGKIESDFPVVLNPPEHCRSYAVNGETVVQSMAVQRCRQ